MTKLMHYFRSCGLYRWVAGPAIAVVAAVILAGCGPEKFAATSNQAPTNSAAAPSSGTATTVVAKALPPSTPGKYGGTLTDVTISDPKTFNIIVAGETSSTGLLNPLYDGLITRNAYTLDWEGALAELPDISKDGLTWTFKLKPGLQWSDGQPITADDVIFTVKVIYDPKIQNIIREEMLVDVPDPQTKKTKRVPLQYRKVDDRTVEFKFPVPYAPARDMLSFPVVPKHKLEGFYDTGTFNSAWSVGTDPKELVASSAWVMQSYVPGQRVVYGRNPHYWKKDAQGRPLPYLDHFVQLIVPDLNTTTLKFQSGDSDVLQVQQPDYPMIKQGEARGNYTVTDVGPGWGFTYLGFNLNPNAKVDPNKIKLFQNVKFRQAVSHAINRDRICSSLYLNLAKPLYTPETPANKTFFNPNAPKYPYDLNKARALLAEIGLKDSDGNGFLEFNGKEVQFNIVTNVENNLRKSICTIITDDLKKVGLHAVFTPINFNKLVATLEDEPYQWDACVLGFTGGPEPNSGASIWYSSGPHHQWWPKQTTPATPWEAEVDDLFRKGAQTIDVAKRKEIYDRWQNVVGEQLPFIYLVVPDSIYALRNKFDNVKPCSSGVIWNLQELYDKSATRATP